MTKVAQKVLLAFGAAVLALHDKNLLTRYAYKGYKTTLIERVMSTSYVL